RPIQETCTARNRRAKPGRWPQPPPSRPANPRDRWIAGHLPANGACEEYDDEGLCSRVEALIEPAADPFPSQRSADPFRYRLPLLAALRFVSSCSVAMKSSGENNAERA